MTALVCDDGPAAPRYAEIGSSKQGSSGPLCDFTDRRQLTTVCIVCMGCLVYAGWWTMTSLMDGDLNVSRTDDAWLSTVPEFTGTAAPWPSRVHFIHIPKCAGSSFTSFLRLQYGCDPPGFCCNAPGMPVGVCNETRGCAAVAGCIGHYPQLELLLQASITSVTMVRDPLSRYWSAFHYPDHHDSNTTLQQNLEDNRWSNVIAKQLAGHSETYVVHAPPVTLAHSIETVRQLAFVGITDLFEESLQLFCAMFQCPQPLPAPTHARYNPHPAWTVTEGTSILDHNQLDQLVFNLAVLPRFCADAKQWGIDSTALRAKCLTIKTTGKRVWTRVNNQAHVVSQLPPMPAPPLVPPLHQQVPPLQLLPVQLRPAAPDSSAYVASAAAASSPPHHQP